MSNFANTAKHLTQNLAGKIGLSGTGPLAGFAAANPALVKLLLLLLCVPIGSMLFILIFGIGRIMAWPGKLLRWVLANFILALLLVASTVWLGFGLGKVYDRWQGQHLSIAIGLRTSDSYRLGQSLVAVTSSNSPRLRIAPLEIAEAAGNEGVLEKGVVQLAIAPGDSVAGPSARRVATLAGSHTLLARYDVAEDIIFALAQVLMQSGQELAPANPATNAAPASPAGKTEKAKAKPDAPVHPGAAAFYDWNKTPFIVRHARVIVFVIIGLALLALWIWYGRRRSAPPPAQVQQNTFSSTSSREPWTFSKILLESVGNTSAPHSVRHSPEPPRFRERFLMRATHGK